MSRTLLAAVLSLVAAVSQAQLVCDSPDVSVSIFAAPAPGALGAALTITGPPLSTFALFGRFDDPLSLTFPGLCIDPFSWVMLTTPATLPLGGSSTLPFTLPPPVALPTFYLQAVVLPTPTAVHVSPVTAGGVGVTFGPCGAREVSVLPYESSGPPATMMLQIKGWYCPNDQIVVKKLVPDGQGGYVTTEIASISAGTGGFKEAYVGMGGFPPDGTKVEVYVNGVLHAGPIRV